MDESQKRVEAILFTIGKDITSERIASLCELSIKQVDKVVKELQKNYSERDHSLQIVQKEYGWKLTVRDEFVPLVSNIAETTEMEKPLMETLAVIAWKYPILQSEVIKLRHATAYEHMKELQLRGFIDKIKFGRTFKVKLTTKFFEYFDLPSKEAKNAFLKNIPSEVLQEAEDVNKEADEVERLVELEKKEEESRDEIKVAMENSQD
jgi:segregation and condensation protein B